MVATHARIYCAAASAKAAAAAMRAAAGLARAMRCVTESAALVAAAEAADAAVCSLLARLAELEQKDGTAFGIDAEVAVRKELISPVLRERVAAGVLGKAPTLSGAQRATRNLAEHALLGRGPDALLEACQAPQRSQRGGRRRRCARDELLTEVGSHLDSVDSVTSTDLSAGPARSDSIEGALDGIKVAKHEVLFPAVPPFPIPAGGCVLDDKPLELEEREVAVSDVSIPGKVIANDSQLGLTKGNIAQEEGKYRHPSADSVTEASAEVESEVSELKECEEELAAAQQRLKELLAQGEEKHDEVQENLAKTAAMQVFDRLRCADSSALSIPERGFVLIVEHLLREEQRGSDKGLQSPGVQLAAVSAGLITQWATEVRASAGTSL